VKIGIALLFFLSVISTAVAQDYVSWSFSYDEDESEVLITAEIGNGWHLYSTEKVTELGPIPTEIVFDEGSVVKTVGKLSEPEPEVSFDPNFGETLFYFEDAVTFSQKIERNGARELSGTVTYMVCNDEMCMPPVDYKFTIELSHED